MFRYTLFTVGLLFITFRVAAITPEELARLSEKGAADKRRVEQQLNLDDLHYPIRIDAKASSKLSNDTSSHNDTGYENDAVSIQPPLTGNSIDSAEVKSPDVNSHHQQKRQSTKYSNQSVTQESRLQAHPQNQRNAQRQVDRYYQTPPDNTDSSITAKTQNKYVTYSDAVEPDNKKYFGIRRGTWIKAELRRDVNNAEPGDVELYLIQETYGAKHTLPVNTQLFANKGFNSATQRLDMLTTYAITPSGREFVLKARIYDTIKVSGLVGIIDADDNKIAERGATSSLAALGTGVLNEVGGGSVVGNALSKGGQSIINDQQNASKLDTQHQITIFVAPQSILLRVEETF